MESPLTPIPPTDPSGPAEPPRRRRRRLGAVLGAGLLAGLVAAAIGGVASAQSGGTTVIGQVDEPEDAVVVVQEGDASDEDAIWQQFDQCLSDAGIDVESLESEDDLTLDEATIDAAFESCEPVLDGLDAFLTDEEKAAWEAFDQCLTDNGVPIDDVAADQLPDEATLDAAFEACESQLGEFGDEVFFGDVELSAEDEAVFERFDQCLIDNGVDLEALDAAETAEDASALDETALDAVFDACEPILDELSAEAHMLDMDCPDDEE